MAAGSPRGVLLVVLAAGGLLLVSTSLGRDTDGDRPVTATFAAPTAVATASETPVGPAARSAIGDASPPSPLTGAPSVAAGTDFADPRSVARAYVEAAHSAEPGTEGRLNRGVVPYLAPGNPDNPRGSLVVSATGKAVVISVEVAVGNEEQSAVTTKATWRSGDGQSRDTFVTLRRQSDGRWLVTAETAQLQPADR